ncbi:MAG TPA: large conductance mechanosensitive channel protein MscL [Candidatus Saccharimonadales bacterium]|nr:large conductance mechanosensitive channel protein MscL [Candidatus Saccharimonadales bacterium]
MLKEFKKFLLRGNVVDLAVAVVIGASFNSVVQALVKDFITPLTLGISNNGSFLKGQFHLTSRITLAWGDFLNTLISFILIAAVVFFLVVQPINHLTSLAKSREDTEEPTTKKCPECYSEINIKATRCAFCTAKVSSANTK